MHTKIDLFYRPFKRQRQNIPSLILMYNSAEVRLMLQLVPDVLTSLVLSPAVDPVAQRKALADVIAPQPTLKSLIADKFKKLSDCC
jgi:hypothetical protein